MQSQRPKCSLFHERLRKKITLVPYSGIPEGWKRCQVTLKHFFLSVLVFAHLRIDDAITHFSHKIEHIPTLSLIS